MPNRELKPYKEISKDLKPEDTAATIDMICACMRNSGGRPAIYPNSGEGLETFVENAKSYFAYLKNANDMIDDERQQLIPDIEGLSLYVGIDRRTLERYRKRGGEWEEVIDYFKNAIAYSKKQLSLRGKIPTVMAIFDLANNHDYFNVNEYHLREQSALIQQQQRDDSEIEQQMIELGLSWDETKGEWV